MTQQTKLPRLFDKIILTLENCLLPESKLESTPSQQDGLDKEVETDLRILGCELIQISGILLKLPQVAMATGQVLFQRFYYSKSFLRHNMETTAMSCVCLASKIEEAPRRIRDVINVFHHIKQVRGQKPIQPMILDSTYISLKTQVIKAERRVLKELGFCVHVKHPHKLIVMYLQVLGYEKNQLLMQMAWNFMNDSLRTDVFVRYNPESIACACIYLTARKINLPLPNNPPWYGVFKVTEDEILDISFKIMDLYRRHKPNAESLEQAVEELRKKYNEIRNKNKPGQNTPPAPIPTVTTVDRNNGSHNAWGGFISRALPVLPNADSTKSTSTQQINQSQNQSVTTSQSNKISQTAQQQQQSSSNLNTSYGQKRSRTRSPSRSRTPSKYSSSKKKSRYSRSMSTSPSRHKKRDRKSPLRDKSDYYSNGDRGSNKDHSRDYSDHRRDKGRKHDRYSGGSSNAHRSSKHSDRFRDRKR